ncbi:MAG: hypothetical protein A2Z31_06025 [candidate division NC10 bacterium RBG_16_65_8]|nr:MAG: hypothetical protein A2Z31_06025 [candidate division NC10 bacterium RBG_16_65_8]
MIRNDDRQDYRGFSMEAVDPTGAGDAFNAGFLFAYLAGWSLADCATWANACGAMTVGRPGGSGAFPSRSEVEAFIRSKGRVGKQQDAEKPMFAQAAQKGSDARRRARRGARRT